MPIYPYVCDKCEHSEDKFHSMSNVEPMEKMTKCPACKKKKFHRTFCVPMVNDGPKTFGTQSEANFKKYGVPDCIKQEQERKSKMSNVEKLTHATPKQVSNYIKTGKI